MKWKVDVFCEMLFFWPWKVKLYWSVNGYTYIHTYIYIYIFFLPFIFVDGVLVFKFFLTTCITFWLFHNCRVLHDLVFRPMGKDLRRQCWPIMKPKQPGRWGPWTFSTYPSRCISVNFRGPHVPRVGEEPS